MSDEKDIGAMPEPTDESPAPAPALASKYDAWFAKWFPESPPPSHPVPYLSGAWHHCRAAVAELKEKF